jgi:hypothetical protein
MQPEAVTLAMAQSFCATDFFNESMSRLLWPFHRTTSHPREIFPIPTPALPLKGREQTVNGKRETVKPVYCSLFTVHRLPFTDYYKLSFHFKGKVGMGMGHCASNSRFRNSTGNPRFDRVTGELADMSSMAGQTTTGEAKSGRAIHASIAAQNSNGIEPPCYLFCSPLRHPYTRSRIRSCHSCSRTPATTANPYASARIRQHGKARPRRIAFASDRKPARS